MSDVILQALSKQFGNSTAVDHISLDIRSGELVTLLGPSGCGKTTTLRMLGGFIRPTNGQILVGGRNVTDLPPNLRNMGFGFQNYARSEEHTSELQSLMRISYAVFCLKKKHNNKPPMHIK